MITIIVACSKNRVIGIDNKLPWHLPEDLKRFKKLTSGQTVLMGRKTYESIGRPLPNRLNLVLTRDTSFKKDGIETYNNITDAINEHDDVFVIGGTEIYRQLLPITDKIELTLIDDVFIGDSFFDEIKSDEWEEVNNEKHTNDNFDYYYITYKRIKNDKI